MMFFKEKIRRIITPFILFITFSISSQGMENPKNNPDHSSSYKDSIILEQGPKKILQEPKTGEIRSDIPMMDKPIETRKAPADEDKYEKVDIVSTATAFVSSDDDDKELNKTIRKLIKSGELLSKPFTCDKLLPIKVAGGVLWAATVGTGLGLNLLILHLEDGQCANILSDSTVFVKLWAVLGGAPMGTQSLTNLAAKSYAFLKAKSSESGQGISTLVSFFRPNENAANERISKGIQVEAETAENLLPDKNIEVLEKVSQDRISAVKKAIISIVTLGIATIDVSYDAYAAGKALECVAGSPIGFYVGLFWNGLPSLSIALLGATQLIDTITSKCAQCITRKDHETKKKKKELDTILEKLRAEAKNKDEEQPMPQKKQGSPGSDTSVMVKVEVPTKKLEDKVRNILAKENTDIFQNIDLIKKLEKEKESELKSKSQENCKRLIKMAGMAAMTLACGISVSSVFASETFMQAAYQLGFQFINGTLTYLDLMGLKDSAGGAVSYLAGNGSSAMVSSTAMNEIGRQFCNLGKNMSLLTIPSNILGKLYAMSSWAMIAYTLQGFDIGSLALALGMQGCKLFKTITDKERRDIFLSQPKAHLAGQLLGITTTATLIAGYLMNGAGALIPALQVKTLFSCVGSFLQYLSPEFMISVGLLSCGSAFMLGHSIMGGLFSKIIRSFLPNRQPPQSQEVDAAGTSL